MPWPTAAMKWPISARSTAAPMRFSEADLQPRRHQGHRLRERSDLLANLRPATKVVLFETLTNPTLKVVDPRVVVEAARKVGAITVCDNTFLTPICCVRSSLASTSSCTAAPSIRRPRRHHRRGGSGLSRADEVDSHRGTCTSAPHRPAGGLPVAARGQDPAPAHGCPPAQRPEGGRLLAAHPAVKKVITRGWPAIGPRCPRRLRQRALAAW